MTTMTISFEWLAGACAFVVCGAFGWVLALVAALKSEMRELDHRLDALERQHAITATKLENIERMVIDIRGAVVRPGLAAE